MSKQPNQTKADSLENRNQYYQKFYEVVKNMAWVILALLILASLYFFFWESKPLIGLAILIVSLGVGLHLQLRRST